MTKILMITETNFRMKSLTPTIHRSSDRVATLPDGMKMALEKKIKKNFCHFKENIFIDVTYTGHIAGSNAVAGIKWALPLPAAMSR